MCAPCKMCVLHVKCVSCFFELQGDFFCCKCGETTSAAQWYRHDIGLHTRQLLTQMQRKSVRCLNLNVCVRVSIYFTDIAKVLRTTPNLRRLSMGFVCSAQCVQVHKHICTHLHIRTHQHTPTHPHTHPRTHTHVHTR